MNKIFILICGLFLSLTVLSDEWPHENISNAVFALDIEDRVPINIVEEGDNSLGKIYFFTNIRNLSGERITHRWIYQGRVMAFQNHGLRLLSARLNNRKDAMFGVMILKLIGTELRHELEGLAIDVMGELGTLYEDSPNLRDNGSWQFAYMMYLGLIIGGGTNQIQRNIIAERGLGLPKAPKIKEA